MSSFQSVNNQLFCWLLFVQLYFYANWFVTKM
ncbi:hypothetical protein MHA_0789 [Mannheimia haemolytica PHL213]|nr:hypothetical protein MHA_0789 [Mannheimia haemolytica PHL213]